MTPAELLQDGFDRIAESGAAVADDLDAEALSAVVAPGTNPIGWLVWHLTRVQDAQIAQVAGLEQVWHAQGFVDRFGLDLDPDDTGYGHSSAQVARVRAVGPLLQEYLRAVHAQTSAYLATLGEDDLDRVVDEAWDPPVTLGVRLVSILDDDARHVGQAEYLRGLLAFD